MSETADRYERIAAGFAARLDGVSNEQWSAPSPCPEWTARDVVVHVVDTHRRVLATLDASTPAVVGPDDDVRRAWADATAAVSGALRDRDRAARTIASGPFGEQPFESLVGRLLCSDTLVHTWDLARATGQDDRLDADAAAKALAFLVPLGDVIRRPGGFGPQIEPQAGADDQARLLNFTGRRA